MTVCRLMSKSLVPTLSLQENVGASLSNDECDKSVACEGAAYWVAPEKFPASLPSPPTVTRLAWAIKCQPFEQGPAGHARVLIVVECRPVIVADKTRPTKEQLSRKRELYDTFSCVELLHLAAYAYQDVHVWSAL